MKKNNVLFNALCLFTFLISVLQTGYAQNPDKAAAKFKMPAIGRIYGTIVDSATKAPVPFASVAIFKKDSVVAGNLTTFNGEFSLENIPYGKFILKISFIGYQPYTQIVSIVPQNEEQDLGNIKLKSTELKFKTVDIVEEKSVVEMNIDRKVFNVDKNIVSKGGTAADVMRNIPSVTVDDNGNAQLRQNAATIYIDGRPTSLTLEQIPADQIEKVEVITNPSAKYEASATGGIINIVMKNNNKAGYNGMITGGAGTNDHYNAMASINLKQKPIGLSLVYTFNSFKNPVTGYSNRSNLPSGYFNTTDDIFLKHFFQSATGTFDYYINNRNTLTLSQNFVMGDFRTTGLQQFHIASFGDTLLTNGNRLNNTVVHFENYTTKLHYRKTFPKKDKELSADFNYNTGHSNNPSDFTTAIYDSKGQLLSENPQMQNNTAISKAENYTVQLDYTNPLNDSTKLETGLRSNYKPAKQLLEVSQYNYPAGAYISNAFLTNHFSIQDLVSAAYINYTSRYKKIGYAIGLRFEDSYYKGVLTNKNDSTFQYNYPSRLEDVMNALFPSLFISKKINAKQEWQFNFSRKINRPHFRQAMPFIMASDAKNYTIGNPLLTPEFINLAEINFNQQLNKGNLLLTLFFRNNQNPVTPYTSPLASDPSVLVTRFINAKQSNSIGMDNTFKYTLFKGFETTFNMNLFYTMISAVYNNTSISNEGFNYTSKLNFTYRMPKNFSMQLTGNYESRKVIPQGYNKEVYFADFALNKEFYKFMTLTFSVRDVFNTNGRGAYLSTEQYTQDSWNRRESRFLKLILSNKIGKADATVFKRKSKSSDSGSEGMDF